MPQLVAIHPNNYDPSVAAKRCNASRLLLK